MKYLKVYEAWPDYITFYDLKKYVIYKNDKGLYNAVELVESAENFKIIIKLLIFTEKNHNNPQGYIKAREFGINASSLKEKIVFQSDNLEEIRKELEILSTTNKYNL